MKAPLASAAYRRLAVLLLAATALGAAAQDRHGGAGHPSRAHVHGAARLTVALDAQTLTLRLEAPLEGLLGFEHRPRTEAQRSAVAQLQARMRSAEGLFSFESGAACRLLAGEARSPLFVAAKAASAAKPAPDEHAELDASFEFRCDRPEALAAIGIGLFELFPRLRRLNVEVATGKGQWKRELRPPARSISLQR